MINDMGRKKSSAASTHKLIEDVPLCAAAAIQRGPRTAAMLNRSTSHKPIVRRSCDVWGELSVVNYSPAMIPIVEFHSVDPAGASVGKITKN